MSSLSKLSTGLILKFSSANNELDRGTSGSIMPCFILLWSSSKLKTPNVIAWYNWLNYQRKNIRNLVYFLFRSNRQSNLARNIQRHITQFSPPYIPKRTHAKLSEANNQTARYNNLHIASENQLYMVCCGLLHITSEGRNRQVHHQRWQWPSTIIYNK
jgi:hypothetical protein